MTQTLEGNVGRDFVGVDLANLLQIGRFCDVLEAPEAGVGVPWPILDAVEVVLLVLVQSGRHLGWIVAERCRLLQNVPESGKLGRDCDVLHPVSYNSLRPGQGTTVLTKLRQPGSRSGQNGPESRLAKLTNFGVDWKKEKCLGTV